jgi:competence ComEA-like helix-hairpin-helix protein
MNVRLLPAQQRGLIILVALGLVVTGLVLLLPGTKTPANRLQDPIEITGVRILLPTFFDVEKKVNLNEASVQELIELPGIGEVLAARIVAYREEHGPFQSLDALKQVSGIGDKLVEKIRDLVVLGD